MSKLVKLPNNIEIATFDRLEAKMLHHQIFVMESYSQPPIVINDGDYIFDVGANIGLCSVFFSQSFHNLNIFAFEPIPEIFDILQANTENCGSSKIRCLNLGLSDRSRTVQFQFERGLSVMSSMYPDEIRQCVRPDASIYDWSIASIQDLKTISQISTWLAQGLTWLLRSSILRNLGLVGLSIVLRWLKKDSYSSSTPTSVTCQLSTISEVISQHQINTISLMKIDTEGSELDVLLGIEQQDWCKIKQFVIEVHNIDLRVKKIEQLLTDKGYKTYVREEEWNVTHLMNIYTIYAVLE